MQSYPLSLLIGNRALEALELQDVGAADPTPTLNADAFDVDDYPSDDDWARMEAHNDRLKREAAQPAGYRDAACCVCGAALYVDERHTGPAACPGCDDETDPPAGGALRHDDPAYWANVAAHLGDDQLVSAIGAADDDPHTMNLPTEAQRAAFLDALTAEVLRRLDARQRAAA